MVIFCDAKAKGALQLPRLGGEYAAFWPCGRRNGWDLTLGGGMSRAGKTDEFDALDLYHAIAGGEAALQRKYRGDAIRAQTQQHGEPPIQREQPKPLEAAE